MLKFALSDEEKFTFTLQRDSSILPEQIPVDVSLDQMLISINGFLYDYHYHERTCGKCELYSFVCCFFPCMINERFDKRLGFFSMRDNHEEVAD